MNNIADKLNHQMIRSYTVRGYFKQTSFYITVHQTPELKFAEINNTKWFVQRLL